MKLSRDVLAGLMFIFLGLLFILVGRNYELGTTTAMGPGYFPMMVAIGVVLCGAITAAKACFSRDPIVTISGFSPRSIIFILGGVLVFSALIESVGLIASVVALVILCRLAGGAAAFSTSS